MSRKPYNAIALAVAALLAEGCALHNARDEHAFVNDCGRGFSITAVDGKPPLRWRHSIHTTLPVVLFDPGVHVFTTKQGEAEVEVTANIEAGKSYDTSEPGSELAIVESK